jgi:hypothetical protein
MSASSQGDESEERQPTARPDSDGRVEGLDRLVVDEYAIEIVVERLERACDCVVGSDKNGRSVIATSNGSVLDRLGDRRSREDPIETPILGTHTELLYFVRHDRSDDVAKPGVLGHFELDRMGIDSRRTTPNDDYFHRNGHHFASAFRDHSGRVCARPSAEA